MLTLHRLPFDQACSLVIEHLSRSASPVGDVKILAIDGPAGAGKSTMAEHLSRLLEDAPIVHMDDLYRGWGDALTARLATTLRDQILTPISQNKRGSYRAWDWKKGIEGERITIAHHSHLIVEGVGAAQRVVRPFASTMVWIGVSPELGLARVLERDKVKVEDFDHFEIEMRSWQGREILHFEKEETYQSVHLRFVGDDFSA